MPFRLIKIKYAIIGTPIYIDIDIGLTNSFCSLSLPPSTGGYSVAYCLISVIGIVGNIAVFIVVTKSPQMRTLTNQFIANLAVADLLVNILCVPFTLVSNVYPGKSLLMRLDPRRLGGAATRPI